MSNSTTSYSLFSDKAFKMDGEAIRTLGIQRFIETCGSRPFSNIDMCASQQKLERRWHECNMGCHDPDYRVAHHEMSKTEFMHSLYEIDPSSGFGAGVVDAVYSTSSRLVGGTERTAEGLGLGKDGRVAEIGYENNLALNLAAEMLKKTVTLSYDLATNPVTALIIKIVSAYMHYVPDEIIVTLAGHGKIKNLKIDYSLTIDASIRGLTDLDFTKIMSDELKRVGNYLQNHPDLIFKQVGKYEGRKLANIVATYIVISIAKSIARYAAKTKWFKLMNDHIPSGVNGGGKYTKGLVGVLIALLKTQGVLQAASKASQRLHNSSPMLWQFFRSQGGMDLIYFLVEDYLKEYVDRIGLAEKHPVQFIKMIDAIVTPPGKIEDLFFPFRQYR